MRCTHKGVSVMAGVPGPKRSAAHNDTIGVRPNHLQFDSSLHQVWSIHRQTRRRLLEQLNFVCIIMVVVEMGEQQPGHMAKQAGTAAQLTAQKCGHGGEAFLPPLVNRVDQQAVPPVPKIESSIDRMENCGFHDPAPFIFSNLL